MLLFRTKHRVRCFALCLCLLIVLYWLISLLLPPAFTDTADAGPAQNLPVLSQTPERVLCLDDNADALVWRLRAIEAAKEQIILSTFDFALDNSGTDLAAALVHAAGRGVQVQILLDGLYAIPCFLFRPLASCPGIEIRLYNPLQLWAPWRLNYRMHDKYLIIDDQMYILGGRNTSDLFLGSSQGRQNIDRDILILAADNSPSLQQLCTYFSQVWAQSEPLLRSAQTDAGSTSSKAVLALQKHYEDLPQLYPQAYEPVDWQAVTLQANGITLLSNPVNASNKTPQVWNLLCGLMQRGSDVIIQTPYLICDRKMYRDLSSVCRSAAQVQIITNSPSGGANPFGCSDYLNQKGRILQTGACLYEYLGDRSLHAKTVLIDDAVCIVGSFNMDQRSAYLDTELMLVIDCPELNAQLRRAAEQQMACSLQIAPDGSETPGALYEAKSPGVGKTLLYALLRVLTRPVRHLL